MFTPGSKLFLGLTGFVLAVSVIYVALVDNSIGGAVALLSVATGTALLAGLTLFNRDGEVAVGDVAAPAGAEPLTSSMWPLVATVGFVGVVAGLLTHPIVFFLGLIALLASGTEWLIQSWSEGASSDKTYNASIRGRMLHPLEFPVLALVGLGVIIVAFSRVMLAVSRDAGAIIFIVAGAAVLFVGSIFALKPSLKKTLVVGICVASAVGVAASGIAAASNGLRADLVEAKEEQHFSHKECGEEVSEHFDHLAEGTISLRSNAVATIELRDGKLTARELGVAKVTQTITFPRSNSATIIFRNKDEKEARLTAFLGTKAVQDGVVEEVLDCTQMIGKDHEQALTFKIAKSSRASDKPYTLTVPGLEGQSIEIMVP
ncbi:hypothetical protein HQ459_05510 [bacterium]|nr:hypothetical protein [bacterium]